MDNWTQRRVRDLVAYAQAAQPRWHWKLSVRPETAALLSPEAGLLWDPAPGLAPLHVDTFAGCELWALDLIADFVLASPVDAFGYSPTADEEANSYWLDLANDSINQWTEDSFAELKSRDGGPGHEHL
jgi:hypothetical protein